jgi:hypothetical protein
MPVRLGSAGRYVDYTDCNAPALFLSTSGDGLGLWQCGTSSSGSSFSPRLARLTKPS